MAELFNPRYPDPPVVLKVQPKPCKVCGRPFIPVSHKGYGATHCPDCRRKVNEKARAVRAANRAAQSQQTADTAEPAPAMATLVQWYKPEEKLPEKTGAYLVVTHAGNYASLPYSDTHKKFNTLDIQTPEEAETTVIRAIFWAYTPEIIENYVKDIWEKEQEAEKEDK